MGGGKLLTNNNNNQTKELVTMCHCGVAYCCFNSSNDPMLFFISFFD
jgi:hypothetical protein